VAPSSSRIKQKVLFVPETWDVSMCRYNNSVFRRRFEQTVGHVDDGVAPFSPGGKDADLGFLAEGRIAPARNPGPRTHRRDRGEPLAGKSALLVRTLLTSMANRLAEAGLAGRQHEKKWLPASARRDRCGPEVFIQPVPQFVVVSRTGEIGSVLMFFNSLLRSLMIPVDLKEESSGRLAGKSRSRSGELLVGEGLHYRFEIFGWRVDPV